MSKVFVHIGLPKTATTTLQLNVFPKLNPHEITYLGVQQPRDTQNQDAVFAQFYRGIATGLNIREIQKSLKNIIQNGKNILFSEEMIVVSSPEMSWRKKLENLSQILSPFDYGILITVREPVKAMFSFYTETYKSFKDMGTPFKEIALKHEKLEIYHYRKFFEEMTHLFIPDKLFVKSFEEIIKNNLDDILEFLELSVYDRNSFKLTNSNTKKKNGNVVFVEDKRDMNDLIKKLYEYIDLSKAAKVVKSIPVFKRFIHKFKNIKFNQQKPISIPGEDEFATIQKQIIDENDFLNTLFGIDYNTNEYKYG